MILSFRIGKTMCGLRATIEAFLPDSPHLSSRVLLLADLTPIAGRVLWGVTLPLVLRTQPYNAIPASRGVARSFTG
jgi:hypothetical protein